MKNMKFPRSLNDVFGRTESFQISPKKPVDFPASRLLPTNFYEGPKYRLIVNQEMAI
jgi:hypothetical protein